MICAIDKNAALAMKARLRCGWQPVAQALGVSVTDLRRACDPEFAFTRATQAQAAPPPRAQERRAPVASSRAISLATTTGGIEALALLEAAGALPKARYVMASVICRQATMREAQALSRRLGVLQQCRPALVERRSLPGNIAGWRLSLAGWEALRDATGEGGQ